ncbi:hypothetical protein GCM10010299_56170 [Streptomyces tanashiensis]|nr:hypothetical protein GCM10010299_56170 [Streptomyces tanashiensis]
MVVPIRLAATMRPMPPLGVVVSDMGSPVSRTERGKGTGVRRCGDGGKWGRETAAGQPAVQPPSSGREAPVR